MMTQNQKVVNLMKSMSDVGDSNRVDENRFSPAIDNYWANENTLSSVNDNKALVVFN